MTHFALINDDDVVVNVLVIADEELQTGAWGDPSRWVRCSYNTRRGVYYTPNTNTPDPDQSKSFRKNFPSVGAKYDRSRDAFINPKPHDSWVLNEFTCDWEPPIPRPREDGVFAWNEKFQRWDELQAASFNVMEVTKL